MRFSSFAFFKLGAFWLFGGFRIASCVFRGLPGFYDLVSFGFGGFRLWRMPALAECAKSGKTKKVAKSRVYLKDACLVVGENSEKTAKDSKKYRLLQQKYMHEQQNKRQKQDNLGI